MDVVLEISTKNYTDDLLNLKKAMSHMESLLGCYNGYVLSEPTTNFGWTFFKIAFKPDLQHGIETKFADMIGKYGWGKPEEKFGKFMSDYLNTKGCNVKVKSTS
ncbi:hypothetical protein NsoK4_01030 [Nitrosopumilus sp. K4]|uniref:hypothetical protein n=1 Tax=Nitrosopumilus sp. K4 TaxID=2795383 RepID=UPI001BACEE5E|nr:hypothetical protein [Nitrosopumilus sp. K4]QUC64898.1 hypothetical protein NsoK4_01030 [Nitrosopumilus sp. K4]